MNFNYNSYNFNVRQPKVEQQKPDTKGKEEVKGEENSSSKSAPETVVLTGNASEIQAAINQATVKGAMGATATQQVEGDDKGERGFVSDYEDYISAVNEYESTQWADGSHYINGVNTDQIAALRQLIDRLVNISNTHTELLLMPDYQSVSEDIVNGFNRWNQEIDNIMSGYNSNGLTPIQGPNFVEDFCHSLEREHNSLNAEFVFGTLSGLSRVAYFRNKVNEYQQALNDMEAFAQEHTIGGQSILYNHPVFMQLKQKFEQFLAEAQRYYELAKNDPEPAGGNESDKITGQNQIEK